MKFYLAITLTALLLSCAWTSQSDAAPTKVQARLVINGQVVNPSGNPVANARVYAFPDQLFGSLPGAIADSNGNFSIQVESPGRFRLNATKTVDQYASLASTLHHPSPGSMPEVFVRDDQPPPFVVVKLGPRAGILSGSVIDASTQELVRKFRIRVCRVEGPKYCHQESFEQSFGRFQLLVPDTPILVEVFADGYRDWQRSDDLNQQPSPLTVASGATTELTVQLLATSSEGAPKLLAAPHPLSPANGTEFNHFPRVTKLEWSAVPGAASYAVEIDFCDGQVRKECQDPNPLEGGSVPPTSGIEGTTFQFSFIGAQPGRWRVWALDTKGWAGAKSDWSWFVYRR